MIINARMGERRTRMKKSELRVGDRIIQTSPGAGSHIILEITDMDKKLGIVGMGAYACLMDGIEECHKYVNPDGTFEDLTD